MKVLAAWLGWLLMVSAPGPALAWGNSGHRMIGAAAARAFPPELPAFVRTPQAVQEIAELSREPDRQRGVGRTRDADRDAEHFIDLDQDGRVLGGPRLEDLPPTLAEYDAAMRGAGHDAWKAGRLPYAIVDRYLELVRSFAIWRALAAAEANPRWRVHRAWFTADRRRREALILASIGDLAHFVGDGSQPLHVSSHYNGWGDYPNPEGFTQAKVHASFESEFVRSWIRPSEVAAGMAGPKADPRPIEAHVAAYLSEAGDQVAPFYRLEKAGGFAPGDPRGVAFATARLAAGAAELRDLVTRAWRESPAQSIGWKPIPTGDVLSGKTDPYPALYGLVD